MKKTINKEFIRFSSLISVILVTIFLLLSCKNSNENKILEKDNFQTIIDFFEVEHKLEISENINKIYVLSERGCISCNRSLANLIKGSLDDKNALFLITISGTMIDITPFEKDYSNVIINQNIDNNKYPIFKESKVIYFNHNSIDTIIEINSADLESKLKYIVSRTLKAN